MRNVVVVGDWPENEKKEKLIQFLSLWKVYQSEPQVEKKVKQKKRKQSFTIMDKKRMKIKCKDESLAQQVFEWIWKTPFEVKSEKESINV